MPGGSHIASRDRGEDWSIPPGLISRAPQVQFLPPLLLKIENFPKERDMNPTYPNLPRTTGTTSPAPNAGVGGEQTVKNVSSEHADTAPSNSPTPPKCCPVNKNHKVM